MWRSFKIFPCVEAAVVVPGTIQKDLVLGTLSSQATNKTGPDNATLRARINQEVTSNNAKEIMDTLLEELEKSQEAAAASSKASDEALAKLVSKFEGAASALETESIAKLKAEKNRYKIERTALNNASDVRLARQRLQYEEAAIASAEATELKFKMLRRESAISSKKIGDEKESRFAIERFKAIIESEIASESAELVWANQQEKYESAVNNANAAMSLSQATQRMATMRAEEEAQLAVKYAKDEQDLILTTMKIKYERAATAASNASELSMETLIFKSELATHFAQKIFDSRILSERAESEMAAKIIAEANTKLLRKQQIKYENAATAATEAHKSSIEILQEDSKTIIRAFNVEIEAKDLQYVVAKLSAERLEQQILTDRLAQAAASVQKENELLLTVCGNVVHDLNSPLQTLIHGIESLRTEHSISLGPSGPSDDLLDTLESACAFMRCAISRTIDFTEANNGIGLTPLITKFDLQTSLDTPLRWIRSMLPPDGRVTVALEPLPEGVNIISTDQRWLEENLLGLLSNGVKFSSEGTVRVVPTLSKGMLRITVEDNGIGIDVDVRPKLFQQISQVQRLSVGGAGLGLYSLSKRSQAIGGSCGEDDRVNGQPGSSFWFEFPFHAVINQSAALSLVLSNPSVQAEDTGPLNVLIVDDSIAVVKMLSNKLMSFGYLVTTAKNGAEGLEKMISSRSKLDLVIMDLQMPVMDGIEATRKYRENERERDWMLQKSDSFRNFDSMSPIVSKLRRRLPIICSSANCNGEAGLRAIEAGVDSFLPKPFNRAQLSAALKEAMVRSNSEDTFSSSAEETRSSCIASFDLSVS